MRAYHVLFGGGSQSAVGPTLHCGGWADSASGSGMLKAAPPLRAEWVARRAWRVRGQGRSLWPFPLQHLPLSSCPHLQLLSPPGKGPGGVTKYATPVSARWKRVKF